MKLIVGLGNPGARYINTRHNLGFKVVAELANRYKVNLKKSFLGKAREARILISQERIMLIQPLTFMNLSGHCVKRYANKFKGGLDEIFVICDDVNLQFPSLRIRRHGASGGHNGLESIIESLGTEDFPRLRIGIKSDVLPQDLAEYVLSNFSEDEIRQAGEAVHRAADACECWVKEGIDKAMELYNR